MRTRVGETMLMHGMRTVGRHTAHGIKKEVLYEG